MKKLWIVGLFLLCGLTSHGQELLFKDNSVITFLDGSSLKGKSKFGQVTLETKYGILKIGAEDISSIQPGYHCETQLYEKIVKNFKLLGSAIHKERELAHKFLFNNYQYSYAYISSQKITDNETKSRVNKLINDITEIDGSAKYMKPSYDVITIKDGSVYKGKMLEDSFEFDTSNVGSVKVALYNTDKMVFYNSTKIEVSLDTSKFFDDNDWFEAGKVVGRYSIRASGKIECWPMQPGQYISEPDGLGETMGKGGVFPAGQLIGKFGNGRPFVIGSKHNGFSDGINTLYLRVVPSPWNCRHSGTYQVVIE